MQNPRTRYEAKSGSSPSYRLPASHSNRQLKQQSDFDDEIDYESLVTEDDEPVDSLYSERQMRLLTDALYASWDYNKPFLACANVGIFEKRPKKTIPIVPDMFLSLNVKPAKDFWKKKNRCYMISIFGKPPELVVEIVSNKVGKERGSKFRQYESMGIKYYVIFDPEKHLFKTNLHAYELINGRYVAFPWKEINTNGVWFPDLKLGLRLESFLYQAMKTEWLSWFNDQGTLYPGEVQARRIVKNAEMEKKKEEMEKKKVEMEKKKVEMEKKRANAAEKLLEAAQKELALLKKKLHQNS